MFIILLLFAFLRTLQGLPLPTPLDASASDVSSTLFLRDSPIQLGQRSVNDIVISCAATIFACTWSAIHPNIPAPTDCWWTRFKRQVTTMLCALLAPEVITGWALRQHLASKSIMDEYNKYIVGDQSNRQKAGFFDTLRKVFQDAPPLPSSHAYTAPRWTMTHGFFLQMGGFMLTERGKPMHTLNWRSKAADEVRLIPRILDGTIELPRITEEDIQDRGKGDALSKTFIVLQTTWFIVQCIARWSHNLPVTELEVVTLAFAMLNGITYALWWHKPQNVGRPVFLEGKISKLTSSDERAAEPNLEDSAEKDSKETVEVTDHLPDAHRGKESWLRRNLRRAIRDYEPWMLPIAIPALFLLGSLRPLGKLLEITNIPDLSPNHFRVPMFYTACEADIEDTSILSLAAIGVLFGSIHLIPSWFMEFASHHEMWLWRSSAIVITSGPLFILVGYYLYAPLRIKHWPNFAVIIVLGPSLICIALYPVSRVVIFVLSLTSLRSLPLDSLQTIEWTTFIPHL